MLSENEEIVFNWHFPAGTFDKRMSAKELVPFIIKHMPAILPFFTGRVYAEFKAMFLKLATTPEDKLDEILPWIRSIIQTEEDDLIKLSIGAKYVEEAPRVFYI